MTIRIFKKSEGNPMADRRQAFFLSALAATLALKHGHGDRKACGLAMREWCMHQDFCDQYDMAYVRKFGFVLN